MEKDPGVRHESPSCSSRKPDDHRRSDRCVWQRWRLVGWRRAAASAQRARPRGCRRELAGVGSALGAVTGTWRPRSAASSGVTGTGTCLARYCMDGSVQAPQATEMTGTLSRSPCQQNSWKLTALSTDSASASGSWTQSVSKARAPFGRAHRVPGGHASASCRLPPGAGHDRHHRRIGLRSGAPQHALFFGNVVRPTCHCDRAVLSARARLRPARPPSCCVPRSIRH